MKKICLWCRGIYKTSHRNQRYCDPKCQAKAMSRDRKGQRTSPSTEFKKGNTPQCPIKKNEHRGRATEFKKGHSWSPTIKKKMLERIRVVAEKRTDPDSRPTTTCPTCHKPFSDFKSNNRRFCSRKCYEKFPKSQETLIKMGKNHRSMKGSLSPTWKGGPIQVTCEICSGRFYTTQWKRNRGQGRFCSNECRSAWISKTRKGKFTGSAAANWKGGRSFEPYSNAFTEQLRELIRFRDGYKCQKCGCPEIENGRKLSVHHIDGDKLNSFPNNLISLCIGCNTQVECNRPNWQRIFHRKIQKLMSTHPLQLNFRVTKSHGKNRSQGRSS